MSELAREVPPGGAVDLLHEGIRVTNWPRCKKTTSEHEARTQTVGQYRTESHRRIVVLLPPPVLLIVVDHKTSTQITHFRLTADPNINVSPILPITAPATISFSL